MTTDYTNDGVLVFPGQGSQYVGMGKGLYESCVEARKIFDAAHEYLGFSIFELTSEQLSKTIYVQPSLLTVEYACYKSLCNLIPGYKPHLMAGHSLGEITALACAEALSFIDALDLVKKRGLLMQATNIKGAMLAVIDTDIVSIESVCDQVSNEMPDLYIGISAYNSEQQTVLSGHEDAIELAENLFSQNNQTAIRLPSKLAFHSPLMQEAVDAFATCVANLQVKAPRIPVISNVTAQIFAGPEQIKSLIVEQIGKPVKWKQTMDSILKLAKPIIELGPKNTLSRFVSRNDNSIAFISTENPLSCPDLVSDDVNLYQEA